MNTALAFVIGLILGGTFGVVVFALLIAGRNDE